MPQKRFYFPWLAPLYQRVSFARFLLWQSRFLTELGNNFLLIELLSDLAEEITFERNGTRWTVPVPDHSVGIPLFLDDAFDRSNVGLMLEWMRSQDRLAQRDTIIEIGANIGSTTIPLLQQTTCKVISVEPVPRNLRLLEVNLRQNDLSKRVTIIERAITDHGAETEMTVPLHGLGGSELGSKNVARPEAIFQDPCESIIVPTVRLDDLIATLQIVPTEVAFVWCDIQGSEGAVIRTGEPLWKAGVPLWTEIAPTLIARHEDLKQFLADTARWFDSYVSLASLRTLGTSAPLQPIASFHEFVERLGASQADVLLLPRGV